MDWYHIRHSGYVYSLENGLATRLSLTNDDGWWGGRRCSRLGSKHAYVLRYRNITTTKAKEKRRVPTCAVAWQW